MQKPCTKNTGINFGENAVSIFTAWPEIRVAWHALQPFPVQTGCFGAMMEIGLVNDGPVTILLDSRDRR